MSQRRPIIVYSIPAFTSEAQEAEVTRRAGGQLHRWYKDIVPKKELFDRELPELIEAIWECYLIEGILWTPCITPVIASGFFLFTLCIGSVPFKILDAPEMTEARLRKENRIGKAFRLPIHIWRGIIEVVAAVESEAGLRRRRAEEKSKNIKAGIAKAKESGVKVGNPLIAEARRKADVARVARRPSSDIIKLIVFWRVRGDSYRSIARQLNERNIESPNRKSWHAPSVRNLLIAIGFEKNI